jgi:hypothetical protein
MSVTPRNTNLIIISDSLNACNFIRDPDKKILKNYAVHERIRVLLKEFEAGKGTIEIYHIRSHSEDNTRKDAAARRLQNMNTFLEFTARAEWGNSRVDKAINKPAIQPTTLDESQFTRMYYFRNEKAEIVDEHPKFEVETRSRIMKLNKWRISAPKSSESTVSSLIDHSMSPNNNCKNANLKHKIATRTLWTNDFKIKKRKLEPDKAACEICGSGELENFEHVMSHCSMAKDINNQLEVEITELCRSYKTPVPPIWFTHYRFGLDSDFTAKMGDAGNFPINFKNIIGSNLDKEGKEELIAKIIDTTWKFTEKKWIDRVIMKAKIAKAEAEKNDS